jgi:hypothetical protein
MAQKRGSAYWTPTRLAWLRRTFRRLQGRPLQWIIRYVAKRLGKSDGQIVHALYYYNVTLNSSVRLSRAERAAMRAADAAARDRFWRSDRPKLRMW